MGVREKTASEDGVGTRWLFYKEPAAARGNRNNYAKTERNGASRTKEKKKEDVPRNGVQKEQVKVRWWWRWHAKEARVGKRTEPVVRRHLVAPYIFLSLPRFFPLDRNGLSFFCCSSLLWIFTSFPNRYTTVSSCKHLARRRAIVRDTTSFSLCSFYLERSRCPSALR